MFYREGLLAPRPTPKLEDHPLSAVQDRLLPEWMNRSVFLRSTKQQMCLCLMDLRKIALNMSGQCIYVKSIKYSRYVQSSSNWRWILIIVTEQELDVCVTSGVRLAVDETCAVLRYYAASSGNFLPTLRDNLSVPSWVAVVFVKTSLANLTYV